MSKKTSTSKSKAAPKTDSKPAKAPKAVKAEVPAKKKAAPKKGAKKAPAKKAA